MGRFLSCRHIGRCAIAPQGSGYYLIQIPVSSHHHHRIGLCSLKPCLCRRCTGQQTHSTNDMLLSLLWFGHIHWSGPVAVGNPGSYLVAPRDDSHMSLPGPKEQYVGINKRIVTDQCRPWARTGRVTKIALMFQGQGPNDELAVTYMNLKFSSRPSRAKCTSYYIKGPAEKNVHLTLGQKKKRRVKVRGQAICVIFTGFWPCLECHTNPSCSVLRTSG